MIRRDGIPEPTPGDAALDWQRLVQFAQSPAAPLALVEVESGAHADDVVERITTAAERPVQAVRLHTDDRARQTLDNLTSADAADSRTDRLVLVVIAGQPILHDDEAREFWTWMSSQRERWGAIAPALAFILTPGQVDNLIRHADALWDWIPLKFHLLRPLQSAGAQQRMDRGYAPLSSDLPPRAAAELIPPLREQLAGARARCLPEDAVRREYLWPLLRALILAGRVREAQSLIRNEGAGLQMADDLPSDQRLDFVVQLGYLHLTRYERSAAKACFDAAQAVGYLQNDDSALAMAYFGYARVAQSDHSLEDAETWYNRSLEIAHRLGDEHGIAQVYHGLGCVAEMRGNLGAAESWYEKSQVISQQLGDERTAACTYHQLGTIALDQRNIDKAKQLYDKSLAIAKRLGDEIGAASTYHQLGRIAEETGDLDTSESLYLRALRTSDGFGNEYIGACTRAQLGVLCRQLARFEESATYSVQAMRSYAEMDDPKMARWAAGGFFTTYQAAPADLRPKLRAIWEGAGLEWPQDIEEWVEQQDAASHDDHRPTDDA